MFTWIGKCQLAEPFCPFHAQHRPPSHLVSSSLAAVKMADGSSKAGKSRRVSCCISWRTYLQISVDSGRGSSVDEAATQKGSSSSVSKNGVGKSAPSVDGKTGTMRRLIRHRVSTAGSIDQPLLAVMAVPSSRKSPVNTVTESLANKKDLASVGRSNSSSGGTSAGSSPSKQAAAIIDRRATLTRQAAAVQAGGGGGRSTTLPHEPRRTTSLLSLPLGSTSPSINCGCHEQQANGTCVAKLQQRQPVLPHQVPCGTCSSSSSTSLFPLCPITSSFCPKLEVISQKASHDLRPALASPAPPALISSLPSTSLLLCHSTAPVATLAHHPIPTQPAVAPLDEDEAGIDATLSASNPEQVDGPSRPCIDTMRTRPSPVVSLDCQPTFSAPLQPEVASVQLTALTSPHYPSPSLWQRNHQMHRQLSSSNSRHNSHSQLFHSLSQKKSDNADEVRNGLVDSGAAEEEGFVYLNQYKLSNETLGHGTYSIVKLAYNTLSGKAYAMKILSKKKLMKKHRLTRKSGDPMQEAYREIAILKKLNHPNIIHLIEVLDDPLEDSLYMVFELLERGEVLVIPTENPLPEGMVWSLFRELILGVEYLHYNGILHRDLKPSNLLLDDSGHLTIADFGLSHMFEGTDELLSGTVGTPAFHAPEIISAVSSSSPSSSDPTARVTSRPASLTRAGSDSSDQDGGPTFDLRLPRPNRTTANKVLCSGVAMDVWSMGVTLFSLVYGEVPFRDQFIVGLYNQIKSASPHFPDDIVVSDALQDLIHRLLEKDPSKRISIAEMREDAWVTRGGTCPLIPAKADNCKVHIDVTEGDILSSVLSIPHLDTLILIKAMLKRGSFHHPFKANSEPSSAHSVADSSPATATSRSTSRPTASALS